MRTNLIRRLSQWLLLPVALFALACAFLAPTPTEASRARARTATTRVRRAAQTQSTRTQAEDESKAASTIHGRVVYEETSRPVRRARLMLVSEGGTRTDYGALTDAHGDFQINSVHAGSYFAFVDVPGVLTPIGFVSINDLRTGAPDLSEARGFFDVIEVDGRQDVHVTVHARRGAAIAGKVVYAEGDPAVNVTLNIMRRGADGHFMKYLTGANIVSISALRTDDRGMFRIAGLPPGEYVIGVSESVEHGNQSGRSRNDDISGVLDGLMGQQFLITYYPSATSVKDATVVKVGAGDERGDLDITIPERELRTVSGVVRSRRDKTPVPSARVSIVRGDDSTSNDLNERVYGATESMSNATTTDSDGRWSFKEIPDGSYTIIVKPPEEYEAGMARAEMYEEGMDTAIMNSNMTVTNADVSNRNGSEYRPPRRKKSYAPARRNVEVSSGDVSEIAIEVSDGGRISGTITVEGRKPPRYAYINVLRVPEGGAELGAQDLHNVSAYGGQFNVEGLPAGKFFIQPSTYEEDGKVYVKSVTWKGKDLMREPLVLDEGASAEGVEIVFSRNPATLRVSTKRADDGKPALNVNLFLVSADAQGWSPYAQQLFCSTGDEGSCSIEAPPGEYRVVALPHADARASFEAEVTRRASLAPRVSLRAGETKDFALTVPDK
jgi:hypothetical protein